MHFPKSFLKVFQKEKGGQIKARVAFEKTGEKTLRDNGKLLRTMQNFVPGPRERAQIKRQGICTDEVSVLKIYL